MFWSVILVSQETLVTVIILTFTLNRNLINIKVCNSQQSIQNIKLDITINITKKTKCQNHKMAIEYQNPDDELETHKIKIYPLTPNK